ncbi:hypothetical protein F5050DRAFT_1708607 [Lentinula boryana]|uniref:Zn(2)-C6 fungal-type domain-containing protein n=1 Tax=Lentinula boryana TaxID=40481 RepID=A0ABQ8QR81_9AGAR|nr:hypothetical protein F5050DRAFT_1708607 [Lentinula boryana]
MSSAPPPPPLQVVPAPPPDRPKRKRLARACNSCHKSKRRCDGTAPCSNCYYASKPCTYTDSSGRTVPAPRAAAIGPVGIPPNPGTGNRTQRPIELAQNMSSQDPHLSTGATSLHSQQSTYGHTAPPYHLPPPPLPTLLPHQQQAQSSSPSHQHLFSLPNQNAPSNYYFTTPVPPRHEWDVGETPSAFPPHPANQSRKRQRQGRSDFESRETLDTNRARDQVNQQTAADHRTTTFEPALVGGYAARPSIELEPALTRELTNLFFTHSHPMVMIIHKPSFTNAVTMNQVPMYLLYAVCALASPHSKQPLLAATPRRLSGRHFANEAVRLMFAPPKKPSVSEWFGDTTTLDPEGLDPTISAREIGAGKSKDGGEVEEASSTTNLYRGKLVLPASLYTAQTLCLLAVYELLAWEPSTGVRNPTSAENSVDQEPRLVSPPGERFRELALQMLKELGVHKPSYPLLTPVPSQAFIEENIEKECVRERVRCLVVVGEDTTVDGILAGFSAEELRVRLPVDETSFEMGVVHECLPEYLYLPSTPAPSANLPSHKTSSMGSELAETIRILSIYNKIERTLDGLYQLPPPTMNNDPLPFSTVHVRHYQARAYFSTAVTEDYELFSAWDECHPSFLRWDEGKNVIVQKSMLETNSNTGAWCFCLIAMLEASCIMGLGIGRRAVHGERWPYREDATTVKDAEVTGSVASNKAVSSRIDEVSSGPDWWRVSHRKDKPGETDLDWGVRRLDNVLETLGDRAASSAAMAAWIWPLRKYLHRDDEKIQKGLDGFEQFCGVRMEKLAGNNWGAAPASESGEATDAEMADAAFFNLNAEMATHRSGHALQPVSDTLNSSPASMLQTQTALPSLKSSGLLDWSSRSSDASHHPGSTLHNHSLPQLSIGADNLNACVSNTPKTPGGGITPIATSTVVSASLSATKAPADTVIAFNSTQPGTSNTQHGRTGLSWMMNE